MENLWYLVYCAVLYEFQISAKNKGIVHFQIVCVPVLFYILEFLYPQRVVLFMGCL